MKDKINTTNILITILLGVLAHLSMEFISIRDDVRDNKKDIVQMKVDIEAHGNILHSQSIKAEDNKKDIEWIKKHTN